MSKPELYEGSMVFSQEADSMSETDQVITIRAQDAGAGKFFVIETERWAFDKIEQLVALLEQAQAAFMNKSEIEGEQQ